MEEIRDEQDVHKGDLGYGLFLILGLVVNVFLDMLLVMTTWKLYLEEPLGIPASLGLSFGIAFLGGVITMRVFPMKADARFMKQPSERIKEGVGLQITALVIICLTKALLEALSLS